MKLLGRILDWLARALGIVAGAAVVLMMVHVTLDVFGKYLFNTPVEGTLEIVSQYYMVAVVFLPLALVERKNSHISVELVSQHMGPRWLRLTLIFGSVLSIVFFGAFAYETWIVAMDKYAIGEYIRGQIDVINWPSRFLLPVGCAVIVLMLIWKVYRLISGDFAVFEKAGGLEGSE